MQPAVKERLLSAAVWLARILVGATFIVSGWAKSIDVRGFILKAGEYLDVWGWTMPREVIITGCVALACFEFCTGVLILTGSLRRLAVWTAAAMMAFMLPLTVYIAIADPVSDCGCFGDFLIISNGATLAKNIVLSALIVFLVCRNTRVAGLYPAPIQWIEISLSLGFPLLLGFIGYHVQPLVDFRPYKVGTKLFADNSASGGTGQYIYEKDGSEQAFALDALPDSTWTFVRATETGGGDAAVRGFEVRDRDDIDVAPELASETGGLLLLVIPDPDLQFLARAHLANRLNDYAEAHGIAMAGIVGASGSTLDHWLALFRPHFPVYSAEDTSLKQLVRGDAALVYTENDVIRWKLALNWLDPQIAEYRGDDNILARIEPLDNGRIHTFLCITYATLMLITYFLGLSPRFIRLLLRLTKKTHSNNDTKRDRQA